MKKMDLGQISALFKKEFSVNLNLNQQKDLARLIWEIEKVKNIGIEAVIDPLKTKERIKKLTGRTKFFALKEELIKLRYPLTSLAGKIDTKRIYLPQIKPPLSDNVRPKGKFIPRKIFIEKDVSRSELAKRFQEKFPQAETIVLGHYNDYLKNYKFSLSHFKDPIVFIVKQKGDFIKPCPCTKYHLSCGYWILNLGFGCPFDCSYCFLQQYANFNGIILPANVDDFFSWFHKFYKRIARPIRIGTGEFCDSLALDDTTGYAEKLVNFFRTSNVLFELKTKSANIGNLLRIQAAENIIISFSLNPPRIADTEEIAAAGIGERLAAAGKLKQKGYSLAFHFDPIIYYPGWEEDYYDLVKRLYQKVSGPFRWISLGTLRANRQLKVIVEQRFPESKIFDGELLIGKDKKLRYPKFLRTKIYKNMLQWIREFDAKTPVYLCMEDKEVWEKSLFKVTKTAQIEDYLIYGQKKLAA